MRERVTIIPPAVPPRDQYGVPATPAAVGASLWADIRQTGSSEIEKGGGAVLRSIFAVRVRARVAAEFGLSEGCALSWDGRTLEIDELERADPKGDFLDLVAIEVR